MDKTSNYSLQKPLSNEKYSISVHNMNMDLIDSALKRIEQKNESQDNLLATKDTLNIEISRATAKENAIENSLNHEISRAESAETSISTNLSNHSLDKSNPHNVSKSQVGLGNTDNTSDMDKPVSTAQQNALDLKADLESPILTGIPKAPTASEETNTTQIATTAFTQTLISNHNISESAHNDIRALILELTTRLNTLADSDDTTLDQLSEIVAYIKNNKDLIDGITTSKINVSDIIDELTSSATDKPISAKQGMILKGLITDLTSIVDNKVDKVSGKGLSTNDYTNEDKNKLNGISSGAQGNVQSDWNSTDSNSDSYIKNKPSIPTKLSQLENDSGFKITDTVYDVVSTTANGLCPQTDGSTSKFLRGDGTWSVPDGKVAALTQEEYDTLGEEKNTDGIIYFITDGTGQGGNGGSSGGSSNPFPFTWEGNMEQRMNTLSYLPVLVNALDDNGGAIPDPPEEVGPGDEEAVPVVVALSDVVDAGEGESTQNPDESVEEDGGTEEIPENPSMDSNPYMIGMPPDIFFYSLYDAANVSPSVRRSIYRSKNLGNTYTEEQKTQVQLGQFHDMFLGDYWEDENYVRWTIVDFDYWMGCKEDDSMDVIRKHHLTIMPLGNVFDFQCAWGASTANGYANASVRDFITNTVIPKAEAVFGMMPGLTKMEYLIGASGGTWVEDAEYELPNQEMIFGSRGIKVHGYDTNQFQLTTGQLAIFSFHAPFQFMEEIEGACNMWLQDIPADTNSKVLTFNNRKFIENANPTNATNIYALPVFGVL